MFPTKVCGAEINTHFIVPYNLHTYSIVVMAPENWSKGKLLGSGAFGQVHKEFSVVWDMYIFNCEYPYF